MISGDDELVSHIVRHGGKKAVLVGVGVPELVQQ